MLAEEAASFAGDGRLEYVETKSGFASQPTSRSSA